MEEKRKKKWNENTNNTNQKWERSQEAGKSLLITPMYVCSPTYWLLIHPKQKRLAWLISGFCITQQIFWVGFKGTAISELVSFLHRCPPILRSHLLTSSLTAAFPYYTVAQAKVYVDLSLWSPYHSQRATSSIVGSHLRPWLRLHLVPACTFHSHMMLEEWQGKFGVEGN